jgi:hypothetical protein
MYYAPDGNLEVQEKEKSPPKKRVNDFLNQDSGAEFDRDRSSIASYWLYSSVVSE